MSREGGRTKGGVNTKLLAFTDTIGGPIRFFMIAGQVSDCAGARALVEFLPAASCPLPAANWLLAPLGIMLRITLPDNGSRV